MTTKNMLSNFSRLCTARQTVVFRLYSLLFRFALALRFLTLLLPLTFVDFLLKITKSVLSNFISRHFSGNPATRSPLISKYFGLTIDGGI